MDKLRLQRSNTLGDYIVILIGMAIYALGFTVFILPHQIVVGGMAGFSSLVFFGSGGVIPVGVTMFATNLLMLAGGYRILGKQFVIRTVFGAGLLSLMIGAIEGYFTSRPPFVTDMTMSVLMGSVVCGIGIGLYYAHNGSLGGTDIVVAILDKAGKASMGRTMMIVDISIVTCSFFLPFDGDMDARIQTRVQTILYGWASIFIYSYIADYLVRAGRRTIQLLILSEKWEEIAHRIAHEADRGLTILDGKGYWTKENRTILMVWCRQPDVDTIYEIVRTTDQAAFVVSSEARSVYGKGFDMLKRKTRNPLAPKISHEREK